jgi:hypothetical protein
VTEEEKARQLAELWGDEPAPKPKRKAGRPPGAALPATFEEAMAALRPAEADFVRHVLAGKDQKTAYALTHPKSSTPKAQQKSGSLLAQRARVAHALALGRKQGAVTALAGLAYDVKTADKQIQELIDEARASDQYSAVAQLVKSRLSLHRLDQPAAVAGASFVLVIQEKDGTQRTINPAAHVIDIQAKEGEEEEQQ